MEPIVEDFLSGVVKSGFAFLGGGAVLFDLVGKMGMVLLPTLRSNGLQQWGQVMAGADERSFKSSLSNDGTR
ncbi:hypothetical protein ACPJHQ_09985 [Rossellomorea sp. H39__3]